MLNEICHMRFSFGRILTLLFTNESLSFWEPMHCCLVLMISKPISWNYENLPNNITIEQVNTSALNLRIRIILRLRVNDERAIGNMEHEKIVCWFPFLLLNSHMREESCFHVFLFVTLLSQLKKNRRYWKFPFSSSLFLSKT